MLNVMQCHKIAPFYGNRQKLAIFILNFNNNNTLK